MTNFVRFVRQRRGQLQLTRSEIAQACGLTTVAITLVETGRRRIGLNRVPRLAEALQVPPAQLCLLALRCRYPEFAAALTTPEVQ